MSAGSRYGNCGGCEDFRRELFPLFMDDPHNDRTRLATDIATRLRRACAHLSDPEFSELVAELTSMAERFKEIDADPRFWAPATSRDAPLAALPPRLSDSGT